MKQLARERGSEFAPGSKRLATQVFVIGWPGADIRFVERLLSQQRLAHLVRFLDRGVRLELSVPRPAHSQAAWTTVATGFRPHEHGILHTHVPGTDNRGRVPISNQHRQRPPLWQTLSAAGLRAQIIGWPLTSPPDDVTGICVSDQLPDSVTQKDMHSGPTDRWVSPPDLRRTLRSHFVAPEELDEITVAQLLPRSARGLRVLPHLSAACRSILAEAATYFRIARWCLTERPWDFAACAFPGLRRIHDLAHWLVSTDPNSADCAREIVAGCYEHHDLLLGQLLAQANDAHVLAIALGTSEIGGTQTNGFAALAGPEVREHVAIPRRSALDVAPTILAMLGVPIPLDLRGQPWCDVFEDSALQWRTTGNLPPVAPNLLVKNAPQPAMSESTSCDSAGEIEHLMQLGYTDPLDTRACEDAQHCRWSTQVQNALSLLDAGNLDEAAAELETCVIAQPESHQARGMLAEAYFRAGRRHAAREQVEWLRYHGNEQPQTYLLAANIEQAERNFVAALDELRGTRRGMIRYPGADVMEGNLWLRLRDLEDARRAYQAAIDFCGPTPDALAGLAATELLAGNAERAAMLALDALGGNMQLSRAHYCLAIALLQLARPREAIQAFESWAKLEPTAAAPFRWMASICERQLNEPERAATLRKIGRTIVRRRRTIKSASAADTSGLLSLR